MQAARETTLRTQFPFLSLKLVGRRKSSRKRNGLWKQLLYLPSVSQNLRRQLTWVLLGSRENLSGAKHCVSTEDGAVDAGTSSDMGKAGKHKRYTCLHQGKDRLWKCVAGSFTQSENEGRAQGGHSPFMWEEPCARHWGPSQGVGLIRLWAP